jgi:uncharacterized phage protein (TIGR02220 family)
MAKELPYFRFTASEWLNDDISLESYEIKGLFIDVCAYYWSQDCECTLKKLEKRFSNATVLLKQLIDSDIIKHENRHDKIKIDFLINQYDLLSEKRKVRQVAGSKGGKAKANAKQNDSYKDNDNNKDNDNISLEKKQIVFDENKFVDLFNSITKKNIRKLDDKAKRQIIKLLKKGYTKSDIRTAIENCAKDEYHVQNPKYLTPEFITRDDKFTKYLGAISVSVELPPDWFHRKDLTPEQWALLTKEQRMNKENNDLRIKMGV